MEIFIVGTGKLALELLDALPAACALPVLAWHDRSSSDAAALVVHAGSGRELPDVLAFCRQTGSILVELATGSPLETAQLSFPAVLCPNTNLLMLKFMNMLAKSGHLFRNDAIQITESHQSGKTSTPGTALALADSLGVPAAAVVSVRDLARQRDTLLIPEEHLARHAFHRITIVDGVCELRLETRVFGTAPYAAGVAQVIAACRAHHAELSDRLYPVNEFIENGWL